MNEGQQNTDWTPWLVQKTRFVIADLAAAIAAGLSPEAFSCIRTALHHACKLHFHAIEMETGSEIPAVHDRVAQLIEQHPEHVEALLESLRDEARKTTNEK